MAAGLGSRFGGLKQIEPIDEEGHIIIDFSIYDAIKAGFSKVIYIIKKDMEDDFREIISDRLRNKIAQEFVYQDNDNLPVGFERPELRVKPWGTGHAVLSCHGKIDGPFAVINADDYYGPDSFQKIYDFLNEQGEDNSHYGMIGFELQNTLSESGHVARGVCSVDENGILQEITERTHIEKVTDGAIYTDDGGETFHRLEGNQIVSMNMWGFPKDFLQELDTRFPKFLKENLETDPLKCEYFLPSVVDQLIKEDNVTVSVLTTSEKWYGVTYKEDKEAVVRAIADLKEKGIYPKGL